jgi:undecaprenyl-diphosphatase
MNVRSLTRFVPRESMVLVELLAGVTSLWMFVAIAGRVTEGSTTAFDEAVLLWLRRPTDLAPVGPDWLVTSALELTTLGSATVLVCVILIVVGYLGLQRRFAALWIVLASTSGGMLLSTILKSVFARSRPTVVPHLAEVSSWSFPSGHSMLSAVVYLTLGALLARVTPQRATKIYFLSVAALLTFLIGLTRVYVGIHYPTDVLAGWSAGLLWALLCGAVARRLQQRGLMSREGKLPASG